MRGKIPVITIDSALNSDLPASYVATDNREGGRLAVVSFHSLEDRITKQFLRSASGAGRSVSRHLPGEIPGPPPTFVAVSKAIRPSEAEIARNPRARSSTLRHATRTGAPPRSQAA